MQKIKKAVGLLLTLICMAGVMSSMAVPAYAYGDDPDPITEPTEETKPEKDPNADKEDESKHNDSDGAFTEEGNLTLTDDPTDTEEENMQFLTVTTRGGHTYYIVIDKNRNSKNVYFLNQVDERDLMNLMSDEDKAEINGDGGKDKNPIVDLFGPDASPEPSPEPAPEKDRNSNNSSFIILPVAALGGAGVAFYKLKIAPKKKSQDNYREDFDDDEDEYIDEDEMP
ncbi:MAG: DUF4366 domain-containing protein [Clostridia bacterium]|nr:DUF4366 domain-containing protein [Clostridia bacterium]